MIKKTHDNRGYKVTLKKVPVAGFIYSQGKDYYLLHPEPIPGDWETGYGFLRFSVVPAERLYSVDCFYYPHARHLLAKDISIEFMSIPDIWVKQIEPGEYDENNVES